MHMLNEISTAQTTQSNLAFFDGDSDKRRVEWELENRFAPEGDPEKPPRNAPKDKWLRAGILAGLIVGAVIGALVGWRFRRLSPGDVALLGLVVGGVAGVVVGAIFGAAASCIYSAIVRDHSSQSR